MTTQQLLYRCHPRLGRLFGAEPVYVAILLAVAWSVLLFGGAYVVRVLDIPTVIEPPRNGTGILYRLNWSIMYPVILPVLFAIATWISRNLLRAIDRLTWPENKIILTRDGKPPSNYAEELSTYICKRARVAVPIIGLLVLVIFLADTKDIVYGTWRHSGDSTYQFPVWDWSVAYAMHPTVPGWIPPSIGLNLAFDFVAYTVETSAIYLGFLWVFTFWCFLKGVCDLMIPDGAPFKFNPMWGDPNARLGLAPLGNAFNYFLFQSLAFEAYIFYHRLQMIEWRGGPGSRAQLFTKTLKCISTLDFTCLLRANRWDTLDNGLWLLLICLSLPIIVISYLPLWQLRKYVTKQRDDLFDATGRDLEDAIQTGDQELEEKLKRKQKALRDAPIWPNGELAGWFLFGSTCLLALAAWLPAWLAPSIVVLVLGLTARALWTALKPKEEALIRRPVVSQNTTYNISGNSGNINIGSWLNQVSQTIKHSSVLQPDDQQALQKLMGDLTKALQPASLTHPDDASEVISYAEKVTKEVSKEQPRKGMLDVSLAGLKEAAEAVSAVAPTILAVVGQIAAFVTKTVF